MLSSLLIFEKLFAKMLERAVRKGTMNVRFASGIEKRFGDGNPPQVSVTLKDSSAARDLYFDPALKFAELYMDGRLIVADNDLDAFISVIKINGAKKFSTIPAVAITIGRMAKRIWRRRIARETAQRNVAHHYDLDKRLFKLFLDEDLQYSCAYFENPDASIEEAQLAKNRHIAAKMFLEPGMQVLDIGCGWGGMGLFLAKTFNAEVTGITLSIEQQKVAEQRAQQAGLSDQVRFELCDYREVRGQFDRLVSIGMFEHVGRQNFTAFFQNAKRLMNPDGVFLLHSIGRSKSNALDPPFIEKYIFPNGHIPALSETLQAIEKSGLLVKDVEILTYHYADTLKIWRQRFNENRDKVLALYDERFFRMWDLYLATSEMSFRHGKLFNFQIQIVKKQTQSRPTRNYIAEVETALAKADTSTTLITSQTPDFAATPCSGQRTLPVAM